MSEKLPSDEADFVIESIPLLKNLLQYHDARALEHASVCFNQIVEASAASSNQLDELCIRGLVKQVATFISTTSSRGGKASLDSSTYTMAKEKIYISIFVAGHVDSGKSTTTGARGRKGVQSGGRRSGRCGRRERVREVEEYGGGCREIQRRLRRGREGGEEVSRGEEKGGEVAAIGGGGGGEMAGGSTGGGEPEIEGWGWKRDDGESERRDVRERGETREEGEEGEEGGVRDAVGGGGVQGGGKEATEGGKQEGEGIVGREGGGEGGTGEGAGEDRVRGDEARGGGSLMGEDEGGEVGTEGSGGGGMEGGGPREGEEEERVGKECRCSGEA
ncbi:hypothetical protein Tco_0523210 [Tanacetum coccineum]